MRLDLESIPADLPVFSTDSFEDYDSLHNAERLLKKGVATAQAGDRENARKVLTQVVALEPSCEDAWMWLASISDYPEELLAFLNRVLAINPANERAAEWHAATMSLMAKMFVKRAVAASHDGNDELASHCLEQALAHDDNCEDAWAWKASVAEDEDEQIDLLNKVLTINPANSEVAEALQLIEFRRAEECRIEEERRAEEERAAAEAARLEEERRAEEERVAAEVARLEEERRQEEVRIAEQKRIETLFADAKSAALGGRNDEALGMIDEYLGHRHGDAEAWVFRSHLSHGVDEKLASLEKALDANPDHAAARTAFDFLSSMAAPLEPQADEDENHVSEYESQNVHASPSDVEHERPASDAGSAAGDAAGDAVTAETYPEVEECVEQFAAADHSVETDSFDPYATIDFLSVAVDGERSEDPASFELPVESAAADSPFGSDNADPVYDCRSACPFCGAGHQGAAAFECGDCRAVLSMSDLEAVLANNAVDRSAVSHAVIRMEGEWNARDFSVDELITLALGHLNIGSYEPGRRYLQEALSLDPNNVVLASQLNALSIRLDEIERQREIDESRPKGKTILVVDDSATVRKLISGKLEKSGHIVVTACDGVEALERLSEQVPDLVLLDITMPRMDGYEVCKQIRSHPTCAGVPVVMISGKDGFFDKVRGRMAGTTGYVTKPFGPETLMKALETYLLPDSLLPQYQSEYVEELEPVV